MLVPPFRLKLGVTGRPMSGKGSAVVLDRMFEPGAEIEVDWAGDSVDFAYVDITLADGTEYQTGFADAPVEVSVGELGEDGVDRAPLRSGFRTRQQRHRSLCQPSATEAGQ
mgnify:CR=1 FL=1